MISDDGSIEAIRTTISQSWEGKSAWRTRLFAFGYDACQLMLAMAAPGRNPADVRVAGLSGELQFDSARRVSRNLIWVQVRNGEPKRLTTSPAQ